MNSHYLQKNRLIFFGIDIILFVLGAPVHQLNLCNLELCVFYCIIIASGLLCWLSVSLEIKWDHRFTCVKKYARCNF